jgi:hypothetical protein
MVATKGVPVFEAGKNIEIDISYTDEKTLPQSKYDIGIAREIRKGYLTYYEPLSVETIDAENVEGSYSVLVPNIPDSSATSSFVAFVKVYTPDNPDAEKFFVTKSFFIEASDESFISIQHANLIQSTGKRFALLAGPHIYDPKKEAAADLATSTNLEITFEANTDIVLKPLINFKKLRSNTFRDVVEVNPIEIKKGSTYVSIPLPTFTYTPGVYVGEMVFGDPTIKSTIQFQYIVAGDAVTIGQAIPTSTPQGTEITYEIFGVPLDIDRMSTRGENSQTAGVYDVQLSYKNGLKEVFTETKKVDFSTSSFVSLVPASVKAIDIVDVKVMSSTGEVVYEGVKNILVERAGNSSTALIVTLAILLVMVIVLAVVKHKKVPATIVLVLALVSLVALTKSTEAVWDPAAYTVSSSNSRFNNENVAENPKLYFNDNLTARTFSIGQDLSFLFKMSYIYCSNSGLDIAAGFSTASLANAISTKVSQTNTAETQEGFGNGGRHAIYRNTTAFVSANLGPVKPTDTYLHAVVYHDIRGGGTADGYSHYSIPLRVGPEAPVITTNTSTECGGKVNINWAAVSGAARYDIYRAITSDGVYAKVGTSETTSFVHASGVYAQTYYYKVKAVDAVSGLESVFSNTTSALTSAACGTGSSTFSCSATPGTVGTGVQVTWSASIANTNPADYTYTWSGAVTGTNQSEVATYATFGARTAQVIARSRTDSAQTFTASCSVNVSQTSCAPTQTYCASQNSCINSGESCPSACGVAANQTVSIDQGMSLSNPGLCGSSYTILPGSLFGSAGRRDDAWQWVCTTNTPGYTPRVTCAADCAAGTTYCPSSDTCSSTCSGSCPQGYTLDSTGACIPPDGRIVYFRAEPDTSATTCPAYWDTEVGNGAYMNCSIGGTAVDTDKLIAGGNGYPVQSGARATLTCEVKSSTDDTLIKTVTGTTRCFRPANVIEN